MHKYFIVEFDCIRSNRIVKSEETLVRAENHVDAWQQVEARHALFGQTVRRKLVRELDGGPHGK